MRAGDAADTGGADAEFGGIGGSGGLVRDGDDFVDTGLADGGESEDGGVAGTDGIDRSDAGRESVAGGVWAAACGFGCAGKWSIAGGHCGVGLDGTGSGEFESLEGREEKSLEKKCW